MSVVYPPSEEYSKSSHIPSLTTYHQLYNESVTAPDLFWSSIAKEFYWKSWPAEADGNSGKTSSSSLLEFNFNVKKGPIFIKCFEGATTNICYSLLDHNIAKHKLGEQVAYFWEGNHPKNKSKITYQELLRDVCKFSNVLRERCGVKKGDTVGIYMPVIPELIVSMLACARIGAVHSIVFGGFSANSLAERLLDAKCKLLITADGVYRGEKLVNLFQISEHAMEFCSDAGHSVETCIVVKHLHRITRPVTVSNNIIKNSNEEDKLVASSNGNDLSNYSSPTSKQQCLYLDWSNVMSNDVSDVCEPEWVDAEHPLFMLYTSGSTGKPKGVLHTTGGYMLYTATTFKYVFDYHRNSGDVYWCTADIGWITGHSYVVYGPLANGATSVIFEGIPTYPDASRFWSIIDEYGVSQFYTAPTALRSLMKFGDKYLEKHNRKTLKVLGTVGEPINPETWLWYHNKIGGGRCPIVDTYWQTETGGHVVTPLPGCTPTKPGSACFPFFGVVVALLNEEGQEIEGVGEGYLVFKQPWPGIMRTVFGDHARFEATYFKRFPGYYCSGDGARRDEDGYIWVTGRVDDMLNVSGHLLSTSEIESAIVEHPGMAEAAAVSKPHPVKGECVYCFVTPKDGVEFNEQLVKELINIVREKIGPFAAPDVIHHAPALPKTRSGKIMRRILRKISRNETDLGDTSTLADESVIQILLEKRPPAQQN